MATKDLAEFYEATSFGLDWRGNQDDCTKEDRSSGQDDW